MQWVSPAFPPFEQAVELGADRDIASKVSIFETYDGGTVSAVVAGASDVLLSYDPVPLEEISSGEVINVGIAGSTAALTAKFLIDSVVPMTQPDVVFWGVKELSFITFRSSDPQVQALEDEQLSRRLLVVDQAMEQYRNGSSGSDSTLALRAYDEFLKDPRVLVGSTLARLRSQRLGREVSASTRWRSELGWMDRTGRSQLDGDLGDDVISDFERRRSERKETFEVDFAPLEEVATFLNERDVPLVVVVHGMRSDLTQWATDAGMVADFEAALVRLDAFPGVSIVDHRADFIDADFADQVHFRGDRTDKYSTSFADNVAALCRTEAPEVCERLES